MKILCDLLFIHLLFVESFCTPWLSCPGQRFCCCVDSSSLRYWAWRVHTRVNCRTESLLIQQQQLLLLQVRLLYPTTNPINLRYSIRLYGGVLVTQDRQINALMLDCHCCFDEGMLTYYVTAPWVLMVGRSVSASHHFWMILKNLILCLYVWLLMKVMKVRTTSIWNSCCSTNKRLAWESRREPHSQQEAPPWRETTRWGFPWPLADIMPS